MNTVAMLGQLFNGMSYSSILLMMALGLAIIFGLMGVINMAHGELMTAGAYATYITQLILLKFGGAAAAAWTYVVAIPVAFAVAALLGLLLEWAVVRFLYGRPLETLLATWGVSLILQQAFRNIFGSNNVAVQTPGWLSGGLTLGELQLPYARLYILALVVLVFAAVMFYLRLSRTGLQVRAAMQNRNTAASFGISPRRIDMFTFGLGAGVAGVAGVALSLVGSIGPTTGQHYIVDAFMVVVLGGVGNLFGALLGAFVIGETHSVLEFFTSSTGAKVAVFALIIVVLQLRPAGLFPSRNRALD
ncbi:MAG: urea ABC transporter permease subunit UrtB [Acidihalobacter sp.]|jgi:urea transport system permease protein